jgi:hypothetical protein
LPTEAAAETSLAAKVRPITFACVDWFIDLGLKRYPHDWSPVGTEVWLRRVLSSPASFHALRSDNAAVVSMITSQPWTPHKFEATATTVMADDGCMWELFPLLRASIAWARRLRCVSYKIASETDYDLGPMARRVGCKEAKYYILDM